jgi:excisionase family DNA binding protein
METYFNTAELGEYLHIAEQTIRRWVMNNEIPCRRIHGVVRFRLSEIEKWVNNGGVCPPGAGGGSAETGLPGERETGETAEAGIYMGAEKAAAGNMKAGGNV